MVALRRILIVILVLVLPVGAVAVLRVLTVYVLVKTQRTIDPGIIRLASGVEYAAFLFIGLLEARSRW